MNVPLDTYEIMPREMRSYIANFGWHFNKRACEMAVKAMKRKNATTNRVEPIEAKTKEEVESLLKKYNVVLEHNQGYDFVYVYNMGLTDYFKSSIIDEQHLALYVKDVIDDVDNPSGNVFRKWYVDCIAKGVPVEWADIL